jgi:tetratricopeptide (TPR) repeat protein
MLVHSIHFCPMEPRDGFSGNNFRSWLCPSVLVLKYLLSPVLFVAAILMIPICKVNAQDSVIDRILKNLPPPGMPVKYDAVSKEAIVRSGTARKLSSLAFKLMDQGSFQQAEKLFLQAHVTDAPDSFTQEDTLLGLAELCHRQRHYTESAQYFHELYSRPGGSTLGWSARTHMEYALTLAEGDRWAEAVEQYDAALVQIAITVPEYRKAVKAMEATLPEAASGVHRHVHVLEEAMPHERMFQYLPQEWNVRLYPDRPRYDALKAMTHLYIGTHNAGFRNVPDSIQLDHIRDAVGYDPHNAFAYYEYGMALNQVQQYESAKNAFVKAAQLAGTNVELSNKIHEGAATANDNISTLKHRKKAGGGDVTLQKNL